MKTLATISKFSFLIAAIAVDKKWSVPARDYDNVSSLKSQVPRAYNPLEIKISKNVINSRENKLQKVEKLSVAFMTDIRWLY